MESKLLIGGRNIMDHTNEQQKMLELKRQEIAEQVRTSWDLDEPQTPQLSFRVSHSFSNQYEMDMTLGLFQNTSNLPSRSWRLDWNACLWSQRLLYLIIFWWEEAGLYSDIE